MFEMLERRALLAGDFGYVVPVGGAAGTDSYNEVAVDGAGNTVVSGQFTGAVDFDPGAGTDLRTSRRGTNLFVAKYTASGALAWAVTYDPEVLVLNVTADAAGNVYVAGRFSAAVDVAPGKAKLVLTSEGAQDGFVVKLNSAGQMVWGSQIGGGGFFSPRDIEVDGDGQVYVAGDFNGEVDAAPGRTRLLLTSGGGTDALTLKLSGETGKLGWAAQQGGTGEDRARGVAVDPTTKEVVIAGDFSGTADLRPGKLKNNVTTSAEFNGVNAYVTKLSAAGKFAWAKTYGNAGSTGDDVDTSEVEVDAAGNVWALGDYNGAVNRGTWLWKLNAAGDTGLRRAKDVQSGTDVDLALDGTGNVYVAGYYGGSPDLDPGAGTTTLPSKGGFDAYVIKLNSAGDFVYGRQVGGTQNDFAASVAADAAGNVFAAGSFIGTADFDPGAGTQSRTSAGGVDGWLVKLTA
jgi:hypothetical protein